MFLTTATPQQQAALDRANAIRIARSKVKKELFAGTRNVTDVISDPPDFMRGMTVLEVLKACKRVGDGRAKKICLSAGVNPIWTLGELGDSRRKLLVQATKRRLG
jgi:hypothetical protein